MMINILMGVIEALTIRIGAVTVKKSRKEEVLAYKVVVISRSWQRHHFPGEPGSLGP